jgi:hypothetical protein
VVGVVAIFAHDRRWFIGRLLVGARSVWSAARVIIVGEPLRRGTTRSARHFQWVAETLSVSELPHVPKALIPWVEPSPGIGRSLTANLIF